MAEIVTFAIRMTIIGLKICHYVWSFGVIIAKYVTRVLGYQIIKIMIPEWGLDHSKLLSTLSLYF